MKKFNYLWMCLVLTLFACTKESVADNFQPQNQIEVNIDGVEFTETSLTIDQAVKSMDFVQRNIDGNNHRKKTIRNVDLLTTLDIKANAVTRVSGNETADQPLAYVVNFENEEGYAILAADTNLPPVIMLGDEGNFSTEKYLDFVQGNTTRAGGELTEVEDMQYTMITNSIVFPTPTPMAPNNPRDTAVMVRCLPLVPTKWGQRAPYNYYAKTDDNQTAKAGCVPVAFAQTLASLSYHHNFTPSVEIDPDYPVNWTLINSQIANGTIKYNSDDTSNGALNAASLIRAVGNGVEAQYGIDKTSANTFEIANELNRMGCTNTSFKIKDSVTTNDLFTMIVSRNTPIPTRASHRITTDSLAHHAFILDGWLRLEYTGDVIIGLNIISKRHQSDLVHVNFGWNGICDGYYLPTAFNLSTSSNDEYVEDNDILAHGNYNFNIDVAYVLYNLPANN